MSAISVSECRSDLRELVDDRHLKNLDNQAYIRFATAVNASTGDEDDVSQGQEQLSADSLFWINPDLFTGAESRTNPAETGVNTLVIENQGVKVHQSILLAAGLDHLNNGGNFSPVYLKGRLDDWCVLLMAAYGKSVLPDKFLSTDATTYIRAFDLAVENACSNKVRIRIFRLTLAYWSSFSLWKLHSQTDATDGEHRFLMKEINAAWKVHKTSRMRNITFNNLAITDLAFGVLLCIHCPLAVYQMHAAVLDYDLRAHLAMAEHILLFNPDNLHSNDMILAGFPRL